MLGTPPNRCYILTLTEHGTVRMLTELGKSKEEISAYYTRYPMVVMTEPEMLSLILEHNPDKVEAILRVLRPQAKAGNLEMPAGIT